MKCIGTVEGTRKHLNELKKLRDNIVLALDGKVILNGCFTRKELLSALETKELEIEMNTRTMTHYWGMEV